MGYIDKNGFHRKRLADYLAELKQGFKNIFGENINLNNDSPDGQVIGLIADRFNTIEETMENDYNQFQPQFCDGVSQSRLIQLSGITRREPTYSAGEVTCVGIDGTVIPKGSRVKTNDTNKEFSTDIEVTIGPLKSVNVTVTAVEKGEIVAKAGTITVIVTPVNGWQSVTNINDIVPGKNLETDDELRKRWVYSKAKMGANMTDALYGQLMDYDEVSHCRVFENYTNEPDPYGLPPHSIQAVVYGGENDNIAQIIRKNTVGVTYGKVKIVVQDSQGFDHFIYFNRPKEIKYYVEINIVKQKDFSTDVLDKIRKAILDYETANISIGNSIVASKLICPAQQFQGYYIDSLFVGLNDPANKTHIDINRDEIARTASERIKINVG